MESLMRPATLIPLAPLLLIGCLKGGKMPDLSSYTPQVSVDRVDLGAADWSGVDTTFVLAVRNRAPVGLNLARWSWGLTVADSPFLSGDATDGASIGARGTHPVPIPVRVVFRDLIAAARATKGMESIPYGFAGDLTVQTPLGPVTVPYQHQGDLPALQAPRIQLQGLRVIRLEPLRNRAELALDLTVHSEGGGAMSLEAARWTFALAGTQIADGTASMLGKVGSGGSTAVTVPIVFDLVGLGSAALTALQRKEPVQVRFGANVDVGTRLGKIPLAIDESGTVPVR